MTGDTYVPDQLDPDDVARFHKGTPIRDKDFELTYNEDGGEYYFIRRHGEAMSLTYSFEEVEYIGEHAFSLTEEDDAAGLYLDEMQHYDLLESALITIAKSTE